MAQPRLASSLPRSPLSRTLPLQLALLSLQLSARGCHATPCADAHGEDGLNLPGGDLPGSPHALAQPLPSLCEQMCNRSAACEARPDPKSRLGLRGARSFKTPHWPTV